MFCHKLLRSASVSNPVKAIDSSNEKRTLIILQGTANIRKIKGIFLNEAYGEFKKPLQIGMCPAFSLLVLEAMSYISTEVGITGRNSVYWELPLPPSPWVLVRSGALALASPTQGCRRGFHRCPSPHSSTVTRAEGRDIRCSPCAPLGASVREHRTQNITGEGTQCDVGKCRGRALQGLGNCSNHKAVLSPHTHTEIVHSNQCGRTCLQDLSCEQLIINNSWTARRALGVTLWVGEPLGCSQWQHSLEQKAVY